ncbi:PDZ domain-containing protein [Anaerobranca californiensis DSM 14826]|jgi:PDZ domain-containing protein|uniref:PDZ domain-containing protein n=1 Tax=Anaerobranca californiensis DSM 14826 TaxID=1120989 RepID=A0A1M6KNU5_9FIRM|nr:S16 family serine protease [Anaerobranca californiensis]SHJ60566.1 PDZ domain-containing protein [Anaerobranca californiensis DSM 14826]
MKNYKLKKISLAILIISLVVFLFLADTGYLVVFPGSAILVEELVEVQGYPYQEGNFYLLTVSQLKASPVLFLYGILSSKTDLYKRETVIPPDMDLEEYYELSKEMMANSQIKAKYVALKYLNYDVEITSEGVLVEGVLQTGTAYPLLQEGDIILAIDGEEVYFDEQVVRKIRNKKIGESVTIKINRNGELLEIDVPVGSNQSSPEIPALGIWVRNKKLRLDTPIDIEINTGKIGGPSAGIMFVLEIYNRLTTEDITGGLNIAGTGEIRWDGTIGPIGGMKQKVFAAEKKGADLLFCPVENYPEAKRYAKKIEVVAVSSLDEVLNYLKNR